MLIFLFAWSGNLLLTPHKHSTKQEGREERFAHRSTSRTPASMRADMVTDSSEKAIAHIQFKCNMQPSTARVYFLDLSLPTVRLLLLRL